MPAPRSESDARRCVHCGAKHFNRHYCSNRCRRAATKLDPHCSVCHVPFPPGRDRGNKTCSPACAENALIRFRARWNETARYRNHGWHANRKNSLHQHSDGSITDYIYVAKRTIGDPIPTMHGRYLMTAPESFSTARLRIGQTVYGEARTQGGAVWAVLNLSDDEALAIPDSTNLYNHMWSSKDGFETPPADNPYPKLARSKRENRRPRNPVID